jgi:hypothetical protein
VGIIVKSIRATTERCETVFGYHIVSGGENVGELRVQEDEEGRNRALVLDIQGVESLPDTVEGVQERLAARGFQLDELSDVEEMLRYVNSYGVRVYRHPDESAMFRMEFVNGPRRGEIVEVDVRTDGKKTTDIPDDWIPMSRMVVYEDDDE